MQPQDTVSIIDNRWVSVRQVARPEDVPESAEVTGLRKQAEREAGLLRNTIQAAQTPGDRHHLCGASPGHGGSGAARTAAAGLVQQRREEARDVRVCRGKLPWRAARTGGSCCAASRLRQEVDDTQVEESSIRPFPPLKGRPAEGLILSRRARRSHDGPVAAFAQPRAAALLRFAAAAHRKLYRGWRVPVDHRSVAGVRRVPGGPRTRTAWVGTAGAGTWCAT